MIYLLLTRKELLNMIQLITYCVVEVLINYFRFNNKLNH